MPKILGRPTTCWRWYERWCGNGTWARITAALELPEVEVGREPRHVSRGAARARPTIDAAAVEVAAARRAGADEDRVIAVVQQLLHAVDILAGAELDAEIEDVAGFLVDHAVGQAEFRNL